MQKHREELELINYEQFTIKKLTTNTNVIKHLQKEFKKSILKYFKNIFMLHIVLQFTNHKVQLLISHIPYMNLKYCRTNKSNRDKKINII